MRLPFLLMAILILLAVTDDYGIWKLAKRFIRKQNIWNILWWSFSGICYLILLFVLLIPRRDEGIDIQSTMWLLYTFLTIYAAKTVALICGLAGLIPKIFGYHRWNTLKWIGLPFALLVFVTMWWGALVTRHQIEVRNMTIVSDKLPESFNGYRIVQISDMHVGTWGSDTAFISRLVDSINYQKADLVVFTGDIVNRQTSELKPFLKTLSRLKARDGVISILGNHDYGDYITWEKESDRTENNRLLAEMQKSIGWHLMNNDHRFLKRENDSIVIIGVENWGEPPFHQYGRLTDAYPIDPDSTYNLNDSRFKILLSHNPEHWRQEVSHITNIDLTLSGHTHAMQFMIRFGESEWSPAGWKYEEWGGLYERLNDKGIPTKIYVNIGSGEVGMPFRIGAKPEITVINFYRDAPAEGRVSKPQVVKNDKLDK